MTFRFSTVIVAFLAIATLAGCQTVSPSAGGAGGGPFGAFTVPGPASPFIPATQPSAPNSCQWAYDNECDEPGIGTGLCATGTDTADCRVSSAAPSTPIPPAPPPYVPVPSAPTLFTPTTTSPATTNPAPSALPPIGPNACQYAFDGECDEPGIGTGACAPGTDADDCRTSSSPANTANACQYAFDGECDEPGIGTGACAPGTDAADCRISSSPANTANACQYAFDGECDEPGIGTGACVAGTDTADCR
ncbi:MAG: hypothetical protein RLO50_07405 [Azospirillaceae bacterium]